MKERLIPNQSKSLTKSLIMLFGMINLSTAQNSLLIFVLSSGTVGFLCTVNTPFCAMILVCI